MAVEQNIPYYAGCEFACVQMVLAHYGVPVPHEQQLLKCLCVLEEVDPRLVPPPRLAELRWKPCSHARLLTAHKVPCEIRADGRVSRLRECLAEDRPAIVFLGAKALRRRRLRGQRTARAGYQPVVVTRVGRWRVAFHDPHCKWGGSNRSLRRGRHLLAQANTFESMWSVWQGSLLPRGYLTLKIPDLAPAAQLAPWTFVETWPPQQ